MKITQEKPPVVFQPVTIVLENIEEVQMVWDVLWEAQVKHSRFGISDLLTQIKTKLSNIIKESVK